MKKLAIWIFCVLYLLVSFVSTIHIISFFELSNSHWLAVTLGIAFELGSAASLLAIAALDRSNKYIIWGLFILMTLFQIQANTWTVFANVKNYKTWVDLFWLNGADEITQKRVISLVAGAILPIVALGFIKSLVDYMKSAPSDSNESEGTRSDGTLDHVPTYEEIAALAEKTSLKSEPSNTNAVLTRPAEPVAEVEEKLIEPEPVPVEKAVGPFGHAVQVEPEIPLPEEEKIDDQVLMSRKLASQLVSAPEQALETAAPTQIDNQVKSSAPASAPVASSDSRVSRGMQIKI